VLLLWGWSIDGDTITLAMVIAEGHVAEVLPPQIFMLVLMIITVIWYTYDQWQNIQLYHQSHHGGGYVGGCDGFKLQSLCWLCMLMIVLLLLVVWLLAISSTSLPRDDFAPAPPAFSGDYGAKIKLDTGFSKRTMTVTEMVDLASWNDVSCDGLEPTECQRKLEQYARDSPTEFEALLEQKTAFDQEATDKKK